MERMLVCFAHGRDSAWQAICVDFDIAVAGRSFEEVRGLLEHAIRTYIEDASAEDEPTRAALLNRRAPWWVRARHVAAFAVAAFSSRGGGSRETEIPFSLPCHA